MIRTQISLDNEVYEEAKREARCEGVSLAEFFRRALDRALEPRRRGDGRLWMRHAGSLASCDPDASRSVDVVVYGRSRP
jgi:predicted CopG family antitoxin